MIAAVTNSFDCHARQCSESDAVRNICIQWVERKLAYRCSLLTPLLAVMTKVVMFGAKITDDQIFATRSVYSEKFSGREYRSSFSKQQTRCSVRESDTSVNFVNQ